ncbi:MAG: hypothetical protein WA005_17305 [Candidatus Binataceae bacterium]
MVKSVSLYVTGASEPFAEADYRGRPFNPTAFSVTEANERLRKKLRLGKTP